MARDVVVVGAVRTAVGTFGGSLKGVPLSRLAGEVTKAVVARSGVSPDAVGHVVFGNVIPTEPRDAYLSRVAALDAGLPIEVPAFNVNRLCGSGLQAVVSAAQGIALGDADVAIGGGAESMSRSPYMAADARWGTRLGDSMLRDYMLDALHDPFHKIHMGITAENVAQRCGISRQDQDALAVESHRRAGRAIVEGRFKGQIVPIEIVTREGKALFDTDEHVRPDTSIEALGGMKAVFKADGTVTAGNASGINDGAAAILLAEANWATREGLKPLARLVGYAHAGVEPELMGLGPVPATRHVLKRTGIRIEDLDVIESNEAFAAQACAVTKALGLDPAKVNPNGSGISLGHPVGATGTIIAVKAIHELHRVSGRYALVTMCIGGGQGIAAIFERMA
jgi:acetyl-CoA C-acetyltransferase